VWHEATESLQRDGKVQIIGIIQEQHPDRARLFMQWKQMGWPIMVDGLNLLGVGLVPITLFVDEFGIIRAINPQRSDVEGLEEFLNAEYEATDGDEIVALNGRSLKAVRANRLLLWGHPADFSEAIRLYDGVVESEPENGPAHFRLGVAHRMRHDSSYRQASDFRLAVENWALALYMNPNQYIWRRRIQQYGPRLDKPYPFYDWVSEARRQISERGEKPVELTVEPSGAEIAKPFGSFSNGGQTKAEPDPGGRIVRDQGQYIKVNHVVVKSTATDGWAARVHVRFSPNQFNKAHWNNEVGQLELWVSAPSGWETSSRFFTVPNPKKAVSLESRDIEFEIRSKELPVSGKLTVPAYALYYVCEDVDGTCLYRRHDLSIEVNFTNR
jgi:hypothetical protein